MALADNQRSKVYNAEDALVGCQVQVRRENARR
jgi:hypothetical protein